MAIESPKRALHRIDDRDGECDENNEDIFVDADMRSGSPAPRIRIKSTMRPRSYHQILEDFQGSEKELPTSGGSCPMVGTGSLTSHQDENERSAGLESAGSSPQTPLNRQLSTPWRKEDTARRHKRFSLPAIALQTTPVTAHPNASGEGKSKRFSLVLGGRSSSQQAQNDIPYEVREPGLRLKGDLSSGVAAVKLSELLGRQKK
jgi:FYVE, RhoGEF and PH domain containing 5/6